MVEFPNVSTSMISHHQFPLTKRFRQIGTPAQFIKVLISTSAYETTAIIPGGCINSDPSNCEALRGGFLEPNASSTWVDNMANLTTTIYDIGIDTNLGFAGKAELGFDDITLGWGQSGGPSLKNQTVGGFETKDFYMGFFGLTPRPANFTSFNNPIPSFMENLVTAKMIPSTSWSYTAGNQYSLSGNGMLGNLVLGGYDANKFFANGVSFPFNAEDQKDLTLQLEGIVSSDGSPLLQSSIPTFVDSSQPSIWLPKSACTLFEKAFNLTYDNTTELYLLDDSQHAALVAKNASITFTLGNLTAGAIVNITLPYAAFDLKVSSPIVEDSTYYFPLRQAANETQYTLGRTFFQEAYVTADYDRRTFSVSQCSFQPGATQKLVSILPPSQGSASDGGGEAASPTTKASSAKTIPVGAIAGAAGGGGILLAVAIGLLLYFFCLKPRRKRREASKAATLAALTAIDNKPAAPPSPLLKAELANSEVQHASELEAQKHQQSQELEAQQQQLEALKRRWLVEADGGEDGRRRIYEMEGKRGVWVVEADGKPVEVFEMAAGEVAHEMRGIRDSLEITSSGSNTGSAPPRPSRWSWETGGGETTAVDEGSEGVTSWLSSPDSNRDTARRSWRDRLAGLPE